MNLCGKKLKIFFLFSLFLLSGIFAANTAKAAETLFYQTPSLDAFPNSYAGDGTYDYGYIFTTGATTTNITKVKMTSNNNTPTGNSAYILIKKLSGCGAPLATSSSVVIAATNTEYSFTWPDGGIALEPATQYIINYFPVGGVRDNVLMRNSNGAAGEDRYWWSVCSSSLTGNHVYMKAYWDPNWTPPACGDGTCNGTETFNTCPQDCVAPVQYCGDGACNGDENFNSCPQDCAPYADSGSFWVSPVNNCFYNHPCLLTFAYNPQIFNNLNDSLTLTQCQTKNLTDEQTVLSCATSTDISTVNVADSRQIYLNKLGEITAAIPSGNWATTTQLTMYGAKIQGATTFQLVQYYIRWTAAPSWIDPPVKPTSTVLQLFGTSTHALACTEEDWAKGASSTSWFNWDALRCNGSRQMFDIMAIISDRVEDFINQTADRGKNLFPFSIMFKVDDCYKHAATSTISNLIPAGYIDANKNIVAEFYPSEIPSFSNATLTIMRFGPSDFTGINRVNDFLTWWKNITTMINWFAFIWGLFLLGTVIIETIFPAPGETFPPPSGRHEYIPHNH